MSLSGPTSDHAKIREWAIVYGAVPVEIETIVFDGEPTKIGFMLPGSGNSVPEFRPIEWDAFFVLFDLLQLSFVYNENQPSEYELLQSGQAAAMGFAIGPS